MSWPSRILSARLHYKMSCMCCVLRTVPLYARTDGSTRHTALLPHSSRTLHPMECRSTFRFLESTIAIRCHIPGSDIHQPSAGRRHPLVAAQSSAGTELARARPEEQRILYISHYDRLICCRRTKHRWMWPTRHLSWSAISLNRCRSCSTA